MTVLGTEAVADGNDCSSAPTPTKEGYTFEGWADTVGGTVDSSLTQNIHADNSLYAVYEVI